MKADMTKLKKMNYDEGEKYLMELGYYGNELLMRMLQIVIT